MSSFICPLCSITRDFSTFSTFFRHIMVFHQNGSRFHITCDIKSSCGVSYRTFSAYKSHIYRHHSSLLHLTDLVSDIIDVNSAVDTRRQEFDLNIGSSSSYNDDINLTNNDDYIDLYIQEEEDDTTNDESLLESLFNQENEETTILHIKKSYISFILQIQEEFFYQNQLQILSLIIL